MNAPSRLKTWLALPSVILLLAIPVALIFLQRYLWVPIGVALTPSTVHSTLLRADRPEMTTLYVVAIVLFVLPTFGICVDALRRARRADRPGRAQRAARQRRQRGADRPGKLDWSELRVTIVLIVVQAVFAKAAIPGKNRRGTPLESWSYSTDLSIAGEVTYTHAFRLGMVGIALVAVAAVLLSGVERRPRATILVVAAPFLLVVPALLVDAGFMA